VTNQSLRIIPLGGLGEFGMNSMAVCYEESIVVIDAGLLFPKDDLLGVDLVIPDYEYLIENRQKVCAIILTHAHEDHITVLPTALVLR
jgi:ribonuclease J